MSEKDPTDGTSKKHKEKKTKTAQLAVYLPNQMEVRWQHPSGVKGQHNLQNHTKLHGAHRFHYFLQELVFIIFVKMKGNCKW